LIPRTERQNLHQANRVFTVDNSSHLFISQGFLNNKPIKILWDSGSCCSIAKRNLFTCQDDITPYTPKIYGASGAQLSICGQTKQTVVFKNDFGQDHEYEFVFWIITENSFPKYFDVILGVNFLRKFNVVINFADYYVDINGLYIPLIVEPDFILSYPIWAETPISFSDSFDSPKNILKGAPTVALSDFSMASQLNHSSRRRPSGSQYSDSEGYKDDDLHESPIIAASYKREQTKSKIKHSVRIKPHSEILNGPLPRTQKFVSRGGRKQPDETARRRQTTNQKPDNKYITSINSKTASLVSPSEQEIKHDKVPCPESHTNRSNGSRSTDLPSLLHIDPFDTSRFIPIDREQDASDIRDGHPQPPAESFPVKLVKRAIIQPYQTVHCEVQAPAGLTFLNQYSSDFVVPPVLIQTTESELPIVPIINRTPHVLTLRTGTQITVGEHVDSDDTDEISYQDFIPDSCDKDKPLSAYFDVSHLDDETRKSVLAIVCDFPEVFLTEGKRLKTTNVCKFELHLETNKPIARPPYQVPKKFEKEFREEIARMKETGILEDTDSPYASPTLLVRKTLPDGSIKNRICFDYRFFELMRFSSALPNTVHS